MKIDSIYHSKDARKKECKGDRTTKRFSKDPTHHPMLLEREYVRALNATKIERMLAKPFITALSHHREGINKLSKSYTSNIFASSSYDNKLVIWELFSKKIILEKQYSSIINGIALGDNSDIFVSQNKSVILNDYMSEYNVDTAVSSLDMYRDLCVGHSDGIAIFDINRLTPKTCYTLDNVSAVKYNRSFNYIMGAITNLNIKLYDNRTCGDFLTLNISNANSLDFNIQQGYLFSTGNEDGNAYLYDIRNSEKPIETFRGHTNAVVSVAFNPDGKEIVTGSFDKTIRIFRTNERKPRDCYYNDRMQIVHSAVYSNDGEFIISGSDDGSLRLWKAQASKKVNPTTRVEKEALQYSNALKDKFKNVGEISRISNHRFLNKEIKREMHIKHEMYEGSLRRQAKREKEQEFKKQFESESFEEEDE